MRYTPKGNPKITITLSALCLLSSLTLVAFSLLGREPISNILKMTSVVFFMAALLIIARYLTFTYTYMADDCEFIITKNTKNSSKLVCKLYYSDITGLEKTPDFLKKNDNRYIKHYNYCASILSKNTYTLSYNINGEECIIVFEPDIYFADYLEKYIKNDIILS